VKKLRVLDLFSGIGGFSLGLERTGGFETVAFCEIEPYCRAVLNKHWPSVPCYDDIRTLTGARLAADGIAVDVICGGFPCQDISFAGDRDGMAGQRSGLWGECARLVCELRPAFVIVENVAGLLSLGIGRVVGDLAALGYDAEWHCIPASALGAPHRRDRVWIVANPERQQLRQQPGLGSRPRGAGALLAAIDDADTDGESQLGSAIHAEMARRKSIHGDGITLWERQAGSIQAHAMADGLPDDMDAAISAFGNAVVPQIPEILGNAILHAQRKASDVSEPVNSESGE
jgi:DNA (cytosine-5)-methyltransferase 1